MKILASASEKAEEALPHDHTVVAAVQDATGSSVSIQTPRSPINQLLLDNRILVSRIFVLAILITLSVSLTAWREVAPVLELLLALAGWVFIGICVVGRIWAGSYICGNKNERLIVEGPYSMCRNPLYLFCFFGGLGLMLLTETLLLPLIFAVAFWLYYPRVIAREETALLSHHGASFEAYRSRVPCFWPKLSLFSEPTSYMVSAAKFRNHLGDVVWFVIAGGMIEFMEAMHVLAYLPTVLRIY